MKNLENYGVQEMSRSESQEVDGGIAPLVAYGLILYAGIVIGWLASR